MKSKKIKGKDKRLLVITGFMGTGKTSVGRIVARKLEREFLDMDRVIEEREAKSVREIFQERGEEYFRARESKLCAELAAQDNLVIATGGGALVNPANRERFAGAFVVCLDASVEEIKTRLDGVEDRPLLAGAKTRQPIESLQTARGEAYASIKYHVDTTGKSVQRVADEILSLFREAVA